MYTYIYIYICIHINRRTPSSPSSSSVRPSIPSSVPSSSILWQSAPVRPFVVVCPLSSVRPSRRPSNYYLHRGSAAPPNRVH